MDEVRGSCLLIPVEVHVAGVSKIVAVAVCLGGIECPGTVVARAFETVAVGIRGETGEQRDIAAQVRRGGGAAIRAELAVHTVPRDRVEAAPILRVSVVLPICWD